MTITVGFRRADFVVLASDQLLSVPPGGASRVIHQGHRSKIFYPPHLPIAAALSGLMRIGSAPTPTSVFVDELLRGLVPDTLSLGAMKDAFERDVLPRVRVSRATDSSSAAAREYLFARALVALIGRDGPEMGVITCCEGCEIEVSKPYDIRGPDRVMEFYKRERARWTGDEINARAEVVAHAVNVVRAGMEEDARLGERDRTSGGNVDVAIVDAAGVTCQTVRTR